MAKSKKQKQAEAIHRLRLLFKCKFDIYINSQYGTESYRKCEAQLGSVYAAKRSDEARRSWLRYCKEAHVDNHGNPL